MAKSEEPMRLLTILALTISFSALAQTRVKENIKQQAIAISEDGAQAPVRVVRPIKPVKIR